MLYYQVVCLPYSSHRVAPQIGAAQGQATLCDEYGNITMKLNQ